MITIEQAIKFQKQQDKYIFVDVRPVSFYNQCHIKGAETRTFVPKGTVSDGAKELEKSYVQEQVKNGKTVVFYCQGKKCYISANASIASCNWGIPKNKIKWFRNGISGIQKKKRRAVTGNNCSF